MTSDGHVELEKRPAPFLPFIFLVLMLIFLVLWLAIGFVLWWWSGWARLMSHFPNRASALLLRLRWVSGFMGDGDRMGGILRFEACHDGLRVGVVSLWRLLMPMCHDFFVPWRNISVIREQDWFWPNATLQFGRLEPIGSLTIAAHLANRLARSASGRWPEFGPFPAEIRGETLQRMLSQWALQTGMAALLFTLVPLLAAPHGSRPPSISASRFQLYFSACSPW
jgi:hypothetical protein